ncbi:hypothetical protein Ga0080574_TMP3659 [Salipiger abyssi]|uniref:Uncharacterized protein n=1 Tax=Salipiger abyssi TaxID=1250539 RepID=A0A1P8UX69_9RHOB|nr:hypothetical protein Ga0080574_TMP3659 [Salipiger abyssi]
MAANVRASAKRRNPDPESPLRRPAAALGDRKVYNGIP